MGAIVAERRDIAGVLHPGEEHLQGFCHWVKYHRRQAGPWLHLREQIDKLEAEVAQYRPKVPRVSAVASHFSLYSLP